MLSNIGDVSGARGDIARACHSYRESLTLRRELGDRDGAAWTLRGLGYLAHQRGDEVCAARMLAAAAALAAQLGSGIAAHQREFHAQQIAEIRARLGEAAFTTASEEGQALSLEQAIAQAHDACASLPLLGG
jgi:hypothetical protein